MSFFQQLGSLPHRGVMAEQSFIRDLQLLHCKGLFYLSCCGFDTAKFRSELFSVMQVEQYQAVAGAVNKRKAEFLAGRYVAQQALESLGWSHYQLEVGVNRCPVWPEGVVGSISHHHNQAICVASEQLDYLGVDIESIMSPATAKDVQQSVAQSSEVPLLTAQGLSHVQAVSLVFSAKESLFKAIYPKVKRYLDFDTSQVLAVDMSQQTLQLQLRGDLRAEIQRQQDFTCHFELQQQQVTTLIYA